MRTGTGDILKNKQNVMRRSKLENVKRPNVRSLKIQPKTRFNKHSQKNVPEIKLCGEWLQSLGFIPETRVVITSLPNLLIIRPAE